MDELSPDEPTGAAGPRMDAEPEPNLSRTVRVVRRLAKLVLIVFGVLLLIPFMIYSGVRSPFGEVQLDLGCWTLSMYVRDEAGEWAAGVQPGGFHETNDVETSFSYRQLSIDWPGLQFTLGTYASTTYRGGAVGITYWYFIGGALLVLWLTRPKAERQPAGRREPPSELAAKSS